MQIDNVPQTDNHVPDTINVPKRGRGRPRSAIPTKYWGNGAYYNVTLHLDPKIRKALQIMAIREETTLGKMASEAIMVYIKWMQKAELEETKVEDMEEKITQLAETKLLLREMRKDRRKRKRNSKKSMA
jgi:hypothetical protein